MVPGGGQKDAKWVTLGGPVEPMGGPWGLPVIPVGSMWTPWVAHWAQVGATGSLCKLLVGPGGAI